MREKFGMNVGNIGTNTLGTNQQAPAAIDKPRESEPLIDDPSQMETRRLIQEIQSLMARLSQLKNGPQAEAPTKDDKAEQNGIEPNKGIEPQQGAQGTGNPMEYLEELMVELRQRNPQAVENLAQSIPGGTQALTAAANATAAASAPVGIPSSGGFA